MEQLQIKYREEIIKRLDPLDIYNETVTLLQIKVIKNNFSNFMLIITLYLISKQFQKKSLSDVKENYIYIMIVLFIVLFIYIYYQSNNSNEQLDSLVGDINDVNDVNDVNKKGENVNIADTIENTFEGMRKSLDYDHTHQNIFDYKLLEYDKTNEIIESQDIIILNIIITVLKILGGIFLTMLIVNMMIISDKSTRHPDLLYFIKYIVLFGTVFYYIVNYLFKNYIDKLTNNIKKRLGLLQILARQTALDEKKKENNFNDYNFLYDNQSPTESHKYTIEQMENFSLNSNYFKLILSGFKHNVQFDNNISTVKDNLKNLKKIIINCFTEQEKKSIINTDKEIIEPLTNSKNLLSKDNNVYDIEVSFIQELENFFYLLYSDYKTYKYNYYNGEILTKHGYTLIKNFDNCEYYQDSKINLESIDTYSYNIDSTTKKLTFINNNIIQNNKETYQIFNLNENIKTIENRLNTLALNIDIQKDARGNIVINTRATNKKNEKLYKVIENIETYNKDKLIYYLIEYIDVKGLNIHNIVSILDYYLRVEESVEYKKLKELTTVEEKDGSDNIATDFFEKVFENIISDLKKELELIEDKIDILNKIYSESPQLQETIDLREAEKYYNNIIKSDKKLYEPKDIKKEYFKAYIKKEIDLLHSNLKVLSISDDDLKLIKNNNYGEYKYSLYIYKYYIKEFVNIFMNSTTNKIKIADIKNISNEKIYKTFMNELNKNKSSDKIEEEKLLKNYKKIFKFLISKQQEEDIKACSTKLEIDHSINKESQYISKDIFNKLLINKDKKFIYNECCKYEKLEENFIVKYKPLIEYEIQNRIIDKELIYNIVYMILVLLIAIVGLYLFQGFITGIISDDYMLLMTKKTAELPIKIINKMKLIDILFNVYYTIIDLIKFIPKALILAFQSFYNNKGSSRIFPIIGGLSILITLFWLFLWAIVGPFSRTMLNKRIPLFEFDHSINDPVTDQNNEKAFGSWNITQYSANKYISFYTFFVIALITVIYMRYNDKGIENLFMN